MLTLDLSNIKIKPNVSASKLKQIKAQGIPYFASHKLDIEEIKKIATKYKKYENIIIIGNGGSRNSAQAFYNALNDKISKKVYFLGTSEPDLITQIKKLCPASKSLVIPVSKSGTNINMLEPLMMFLNYPLLIITGNQENTLRSVGKIKKTDIVTHPDISGRFSGRSTCALLPAQLMGLDAKKINNGAMRAYKNFAPSKKLKDNPALSLAACLYLLEKKGYTEICNLVYSSYLSGFLPLIVQLVHETIGKKQTGLTFYGSLGPEIQHHTTQRFFGGRKNVVGLFTVVEKQKNNNLTIKVPKNLKDIPYSKHTLNIFDNLNCNASLKDDFEGVKGHAKKDKIPHAVLSLKELTEESVGEFLAFWQYFNYYSALLRNMNPFNQPEVQKAKEISLKLRLKK